MKKFALLISLTTLIFQSQAQVFIAKKCQIDFFSAAPLEDIKAINKYTTPLLNTLTGAIVFKVKISSFEFESALMQEHFNENYMESEKFPYSLFDGKIIGDIDYKKDGTYQVTANGKLTLHGVTKEVTVPGVITVKGNEIMINAKTPLTIKEYDIKVPSLYVKNIAETVDVTIDATLIPYIKKD
ncbi:MAG: hypothetical protein RIQ89_378 [Bacteroidota bacterium]|jgi:hypothetical protein